MGGGKTSVMNMIRFILDNNAQTNNTIKSSNLNDITTIGDIINILIKYRGKKSMNKDTPQIDKRILEIDKPINVLNKMNGFVTIWFNPWKYESTEQIWSGLLDSIITGIAIRLTPFERKIFYLKLNLGEKAGGDILRWLRSYIFSYIWKHLRYWIIISIIGIVGSIIGILGNYNYGDILGLSGISISTIVGFSQYFLKNNEIKKEAVDKFLGNLVEPPEYKKNIGAIHKATNDLNIVFEAIPSELREKPIIIFIDDLDRCSPNKVADVFEGINLFLSGELQNCILIMAMDAEMISASLEKAHEGIISKIPKYSSHMPIGWKFMDKFIQLPILLPHSINLNKFVVNLISVEPEVDDISISKDRNKNFDDKEIPNNSKNNRENKWDIEKRIEIDRSSTGANIERSTILQEINTRLDKISDSDNKIISLVRKMAMDYSKNPREIKRFVNTMRFLIYLTSILNDYNLTIQQISRWTFLWLKWPQLVRWMYWNNDNSTIKEKLITLEKMAKESKDFDDWYNKLKKFIGIKSDIDIGWVSDENLMRFFKEEAESSIKIFDGAGKGIY